MLIYSKVAVVFCFSVIKWHYNCATNIIGNSSEGISCLICKQSHLNDDSSDTDSNSNLLSVDPDLNFHHNTVLNNCDYYEYEFFTSIPVNSWNKKLTLYHVNARSLNSNFINLLTSLNSVCHKFSVIGVTETWLNEADNFCSLYNIPGFNLEKASRQGYGGGVALYVNSSLKYKLRPDLSIFVLRYL